MPTQSNITHVKGDTLQRTVTFQTGDGSAVDITGWTVKMAIHNGTTVLASEEVTSHSDPTNGITILTLTSVEMDIDIGVYSYQIEYTDTLSTVKTVLEGAFTITSDYA